MFTVTLNFIFDFLYLSAMLYVSQKKIYIIDDIFFSTV